MILPWVDLVFKNDKMRVYTKGTVFPMNFGDIWYAHTGFFLEFEMDEIYEIDFPLDETSSSEDVWTFAFSYDGEPAEHFWNYLTEDRMLARYGKGWYNPNEINDLDRGEWEFKISENTKNEIENIFSQ
jgi:hypothetical protein